MDIKNWLVSKIAEESGYALDAINCDEALENFDLDSLSSVSIAFEMENEFNLPEINPTVFSEFNTINKLTEWIQSQV